MNMQNCLSYLAILCVAALSRPVFAQSAEPPKLFPVEQGDKVGFIDKTGNVVLPFSYLKGTRGFSEGLAAVLTESGWNFINESGDTKIKLGKRFLQASDFSEGMAPVLTKDGWGFIDTNGQEAVRAEYELVFSFSEGFASANKPQQQPVFIDKKGTVCFPDYVPSVTTFSEGFAGVSRRSDTGESKRLRGYIDKSGKVIIPFEYDSAGACKEGVMLVCKGKSWFGVNTNGDLVIKRAFQSMGGFREGLSSAKADDLWGYIDHQGEMVIAPKYEESRRFSEGLAAVKLDGKWGFIDKTGKMVIEPQFKSTKDFAGGLAQVSVGSTKSYIDKTGKLVWHPPE